MTHPIQHAIASRVSVNRFIPDRPLSDETIESLVAQATLAPSAYNLQNWRFIAVRSPEAKARLKALAFGQQKVADASAAFIVCGTLAAHERLGQALAPSVQAGIMDERAAQAWIAQATLAHADDLVLQRDEAIRSASLAAMTLILAAQGLGLASCAMGGLDMEGLAREFDLAPTDLPVLVVTVGHAAPGNWPQKARRPVADVLDVV